PEKRQYEIAFPNVVRIEHTYRPKLVLDETKVEPLVLDVADVVTSAELGALLAGRPSVAALTQVELERLAKQLRMQYVLFRTAASLYDELQPNWKGTREYLLAQVVGLVERFLRSDRLVFRSAEIARDELRRRVLITVHMNK